MTNQEKAKEIGAKHGIGTSGFDRDIINAIEEMAEYKDRQFKEYLEKKKAESFEGRMVNVKDFINEIINELFGGE